jgi:hypothetical protein
MRTIGIAASWLTIGVGIGLLLRAILILGHPQHTEQKED